MEKGIETRKVEKSAKLLLSLYEKTVRVRKVGRVEKVCGSWREVAKALGPFNPGTLSEIASGNRRASNKLLLALGLPPVRMLPARVCPHHGVVHVAQKCPKVKKTFEENAAEYDAWKIANADKLNAIVSAYLP